jgi:hypothetical protein
MNQILDTVVIKSRRIPLAGHAAHIGEMRNAYKFFFWKTEGKIPLERPKYRLENTIKTDLKEIICADEDWIHRDGLKYLVNTTMNLRVP